MDEERTGKLGRRQSWQLRFDTLGQLSLMMNDEVTGYNISVPNGTSSSKIIVMFFDMKHVIVLPGRVM
ncbi:hypothetical protein JXB12_09685 [candidate division KSB1 bacterium]|nr:hypothetical protein [candidate division KSB1 bacterium]